MLDLLDYRRQVFALYALIRTRGSDDPAAFNQFKATRDDLFGNHPQTPLTAAQVAAFKGVQYWEYDPAYRVVAALAPATDAQTYTLAGGDDGDIHVKQIGTVRFSLPTGDGELGVYWIAGYGGGVFIPFRDATNSDVTYGGGRYLYDTIKGADLGTSDDDALILDFNYAYHPSCYYNPRWTCPLAPPQNQLTIAVRAGEQGLI